MERISLEARVETEEVLMKAKVTLKSAYRPASEQSSPCIYREREIHWPGSQLTFLMGFQGSHYTKLKAFFLLSSKRGFCHPTPGLEICEWPWLSWASGYSVLVSEVTKMEKFLLVTACHFRNAVEFSNIRRRQYRKFTASSKRMPVR